MAAGPYFGHNPAGHPERSDGYEPPNYRCEGPNIWFSTPMEARFLARLYAIQAA